jgi:hypothetical protein
MPDTRNPDTYRARAAKWRAEAEALPLGKDRDTAVILAENYERLAELIALDEFRPDTRQRIKPVETSEPPTGRCRREA